MLQAWQPTGFYSVTNLKVAAAGRAEESFGPLVCTPVRTLSRRRFVYVARRWCRRVELMSTNRRHNGYACWKQTLAILYAPRVK